MRRASLLLVSACLVACNAAPTASSCLTNAECPTPTVCSAGRCTVASTTDAGIDASPGDASVADTGADANAAGTDAGTDAGSAG